MAYEITIKKIQNGFILEIPGDGAEESHLEGIEAVATASDEESFGTSDDICIPTCGRQVQPRSPSRSYRASYPLSLLAILYFSTIYLMDQVTKQFIMEENEKLATMVAKGFAAVQDQLDVVHATMATKEEVDKRFDAVETRLDRIEESVEHYRTDMDRVVDNVRVLKTAGGIV